MKKRRQKAAEAASLEEQEDEIRQKFKKQRIADEVGQIQAEKLFTPITKRMGPSQGPQEPPPAGAPADRPDYGIDEEEEQPDYDFDGEEWSAPYAGEEELEGEEEEQPVDEESAKPSAPLVGKNCVEQMGAFLQKNYKPSLGATVGRLIKQFEKSENPLVKEVKTGPLKGFSLEDLKMLTPFLIKEKAMKSSPTSPQGETTKKPPAEEGVSDSE